MTKKTLIPLLLLAAGAGGCTTREANDDRIPRTAVYLPFTTEADWHRYGVGGALDSRAFIRNVSSPAESVPRDYPYPDYSYTGYGGILLVCDVNSEARAYDMSCPVERQPDVRVAVNRQTNLARCAKCGSTYDIFGIQGGYGAPVDGPAAIDAYWLRTYRVIYGVDGRYALISF